MSRKRDDTEALLDPRRPVEQELEASVAHGFTLAAVGDCISPRPLAPLLKRDEAFAGVVELLRRAGVAFGNLETSILDVRALRAAPRRAADGGRLVPHGAARSGEGSGRARPPALFSRANNHAMDWGPEGMRETSRHLDAAELMHAGSGDVLAAARAPRYLETIGVGGSRRPPAPRASIHRTLAGKGSAVAPCEGSERLVGGRFGLPESQAVPLGQPRDRRKVDVEPVTVDDIPDRCLVPIACRQERGELAEVVLEPGRRDQLEYARRLVCRVPECVREPTRLRHEIAWPGLEHIVPELDADVTFEDVGVLVLVVMRVDGRAKGARWEGMLDEAECTARGLAVDQEADAEGEEMHDVAFIRAEHVANRCLHRPLLSLYGVFNESCALARPLSNFG